MSKIIVAVSPSQTTKPPRLPRYKRAKQPPAMLVTERDMLILRHVGEYRVMTRQQIERLLFPPDGNQDHPTKTSICRRRLCLLYHNGYLERFPAPVRAGAWAWRPVYRLTAKGARLISEDTGVLDPSYWGAGFDRDQRRTKVSLLFLEHTLRTNDVRIAVTLAAQSKGYRVEKWLDDTRLKAEHMRDHVVLHATQGRSRRVAVLPDAYIILSIGDRRAHFFLELDQATMSNERWRTRALAYLDYTASGKYEARYKTRSLRILTVTTTAKRLANLRATTEKAGGGRLFWFTTYAEAMDKGILCEEIWRVAGDGSVSALIKHH